MIHVAQVQGRAPFKEAQYSQATQSFRALFFGVSPKTQGTQRTAPTARLTGPFLPSPVCLSPAFLNRFLPKLSSGAIMELGRDTPLKKG